jgi:predicted  nucleic acid-binding Zn-ribbon protein
MAIRIPIISEFNPKGVQAAKAEFAQLQGTGSKAMFLLQKAVLPAAAAIGTFTSVIAPAIRAASDFQEATSKVNVVFGRASKSVKDFADGAARNLGQSKQAVLDAAGTFGTFGKAAGLAGEDLSTFTTDFVTLSTDLASFNNTSPEEAVLAIGAALRGESEPLRRYGVLLNDAVLKQEAMTLGIYKGKGALTSQQKVLAAQSAIYKQTGDAQGDFMRTSDGLANSQRTLKATFDDIKVSIGNAFLKNAEGATKNLLFLIDALKKIPAPSGEAESKLKSFNDTVRGMTNPVIQLWRSLTLLRQITEGAGPATGAWNNELRRSAQQTMRLSDEAGIFNKKLLEQEENVGGAKKEVESYAKALKEGLGDALDNAKDALDDAKDAFNDFATTVSDGIKSAFSFSDAQAAGEETGAGFLDGLRTQVAGVVEYARKIQALLDAGLSKDALAKVLESGAVAGESIAGQLIKGGETAINETNALVDSANAAAEKVGMNAAAKWYQSGIDSAQKMVDGIQTELDKLTPKLMAKMDALAAKLKRTVDIDVRVTETVNRVVATIASGQIPKMAEGGIVSRPTLALIGEAGPEAVVPLSKMGSGGGDVNINVTGGLSTSAEIGQSVVNALRAYSRSAGPLALNIA